MIKKGYESINARAEQNATVVKPASEVAEKIELEGKFVWNHMRVFSDRIEQYTQLRDKAELIHKKATAGILSRIRLAFQLGFKNANEVLDDIKEQMASMQYVLAEGDFDNLVTDVGARYILDNGLAGSSYTAAFYMGLISSTSWSAVNAADTMASHAGWLEAGATNAPTYSQGSRPTAAWSAASSRSKALSSALAFSITGTGTVKGCFLTTVATKDGTTGTLYSAGTFTGGDRAVVNLDTLNVSYTASA